MFLTTLFYNLRQRDPDSTGGGGEATDWTKAKLVLDAPIPSVISENPQDGSTTPTTEPPKTEQPVISENPQDGGIPNYALDFDLDKPESAAPVPPVTPANQGVFDAAAYKPYAEKYGQEVNSLEDIGKLFAHLDSQVQEHDTYKTESEKKIQAFQETLNVEDKLVQFVRDLRKDGANSEEIAHILNSTQNADIYTRKVKQTLDDGRTIETFAVSDDDVLFEYFREKNQDLDEEEIISYIDETFSNTIAKREKAKELRAILDTDEKQRAADLRKILGEQRTTRQNLTALEKTELQNQEKFYEEQQKVSSGQRKQIVSRLQQPLDFGDGQKYQNGSNAHLTLLNSLTPEGVQVFKNFAASEVAGSAELMFELVFTDPSNPGQLIPNYEQVMQNIMFQYGHDKFIQKAARDHVRTLRSKKSAEQVTEKLAKETQNLSQPTNTNGTNHSNTNEKRLATDEQFQKGLLEGKVKLVNL